MRKVLFYGSLIMVLVIAIVVYNFNHHTTLSVNGSTASPWQPARLSIPGIHLDAQVINVGKTSSGEMDAPTSDAVNSPYWTHVFWYQFGAIPGQAGNAVIAGHINRVDGNPAVFWSLGDLKVGDPIYIQTLNDTTLKFAVERIEKYQALQPTQDKLNEVFGPTAFHRLNLITCTGDWAGSTYDHRLVVFTKQVTS